MDIKVDFNPEDVAKKLAEAIASSSLNALFETAIKKHIDSLNNSSGWMEKVIDDVVRQMTSDVIHTVYNENYREQIRQLILKKFTDEKLEGLVSRFLDKLDLSRY